MNPERYARIREIFLAAEELSKAERLEFVRSQVDGDSELFDEVVSLLDEHDDQWARHEGDSAKLPAIPSAAALSSDAPTADQPPKEQHDGTDSGGLIPRAPGGQSMPFLPNSQVGGQGDRAAGSDSVTSLSQRGPLSGGTAKNGGAGKKPKSNQVTQRGAQRTHASPKFPKEQGRNKSRPATRFFDHRLRRHRRFNLIWLLLAVILPTGAIGWWTFRTVQTNLRQTAARELTSAASGVASRVQQLLEHRVRIAETWSRDSQLGEAILALVNPIASSDKESNGDSVSSPIRLNTLVNELTAPDVLSFVVWDRTGTVVANSNVDAAGVGEPVAPEIAAYVARAVRGETTLFGPKRFDAFAGEDSQVAAKPQLVTPQVAIMVPIIDGDQNVIATMAFYGSGFYEELDTIFRESSLADGLNVYGVDSSGILLTSLSHTSGDENDLESLVCQMRVTDPGDAVEDLDSVGESRRRQPLTYSVAGLVSGVSDNRTQPYRDYRGVPVVGAWNWIEPWQMGIVVERPAAGFFAAANWVMYGFGSLIVLLATTTVVAATRVAARTSRMETAVHPLSRYELVSELGSGGMGLVYRAKHKQLGRDTALKVLRGDRGSREDQLRFDREARLAASLSSPHTVTIYDYGVSDEGEAYCVMEFLNGITLYDTVARSGFQDFGRTFFILRQICDSLGEAHHLGLVHRDIKPQNVMLSMDAAVGDWAVVFDFGLAKPLQPDADAFSTSETIWAGTPMYMAPERYREPNKIDPRSDIYSIGCIAYFLLSGRPPFIECDPESLFALVLAEEPISIHVHRDENIPSEIDEFVHRCMAKNVGDRFANIDDLAARLDQLMAKYPWTSEQARSWWRIHGDDA